MGKGPPGGRRQADRIDYRTEPRRSVAPDRDRDAARTHAGGMAMMLVERQRRPAFLLLLLAVSSRVATAAVAVDDGSFPSSRHKPPALPQAFVATVNTVHCCDLVLRPVPVQLHGQERRAVVSDAT
jgi:hypothetical protein